MDNKILELLISEIEKEARTSPKAAARSVALVLEGLGGIRFNKQELGRCIRESESADDCIDLARTMTEENGELEFSFSRVYRAEDFKKEDIEYLNKGTESGAFVLVGSNDIKKIESEPDDCIVGCWANSVGSDGGIALNTIFKSNRYGLPWGDVSFCIDVFRYVRIFNAPYGKLEFTTLPSENAGAGETTTLEGF